MKTLEEVIGKHKRSKRKPGFNTVYEEALVRRNEVRLKWLADKTNYLNGERCTTKRKETHNIYRGEKRKYINKMIEEAESDHRSRQLYQKVYGMKK